MSDPETPANQIFQLTVFDDGSDHPVVHLWLRKTRTRAQVAEMLRKIADGFEQEDLERIK